MTELATTIHSVTDQWDEPLDEQVRQMDRAAVADLIWQHRQGLTYAVRALVDHSRHTGKPLSVLELADILDELGAKP